MHHPLLDSIQSRLCLPGKLMCEFQKQKRCYMTFFGHIFNVFRALLCLVRPLSLSLTHDFSRVGKTTCFQVFFILLQFTYLCMMHKIEVFNCNLASPSKFIQHLQSATIWISLNKNAHEKLLMVLTKVFEVTKKENY